MFFTAFACQGKQTDRPLMTPKYDGVVAMSPHSMHSTFKRKIRDEVSELHQEQEAVGTQISSFQEISTAHYCSHEHARRSPSSLRAVTAVWMLH